MFTKLVERFRSRVLLAAQTTAAAAQGYLAPTPGVMGLTLRAVVTKGNAAALALSLKYANDAAGAGATDYPVNVPVFVNGVREAADAKTYSVDPAAGNFIVDFCLDPSTIPEGKFVGLSFGISNAATLLSAELIEDVAYKPTAS